MKLTLYLNGSYFQDMGIEIPPYEQLDEYKDKNFELNQRKREQYVNYQVEVMKILYTRQLIKCQWNYEIMLTVESKMTNYIEQAA